MPSVDNRVVSMTFDNDRFMSKLEDTIDSLNKLSDSIDKAGQNDAFDQLNTAANSFDIGNMADAVDNISSKFSTLGAIGFTAIQHVTESVFGFVSKLADIGKQDILEPILTGGKQRAMNIEQAKFMFEGLGIDVTKAMDSAKSAVLGTAYGLDAAAKVAAQLGASGIKVGDQMTGALRGIAGAAAMTGSSFSEIGDIFAQSAASGKVRTIDLEQFSTRGLNAAAAIAKVMGKTEAQVRDMASNGTLDFATFAGAMDKAFGKHATEANKTYAGSLDNLHAAMSRMGEALLAPRLDQERDIFNALTPDIDKLTAAMKPLFKVFSDVGDVASKKIIAFLKNIDFKQIEAGFKVITAGAREIVSTLGKVGDSIKLAFKDVFPTSSVGLFLKLANVFKLLADHLQPSAVALKTIRDVFHALFGIVKVGFDIIKGIVGILEHLGRIFKDITASTVGANGGILGLIDKFALLIIKVEDFLTKGGGLERFFIKVNFVIDTIVIKISEFIGKVKEMADVIKVKLDGPTKAIDEFANKVQKFFFGDSPLGKADKDHSGVTDGTNRIQQRLDQISSGFDKFTNFFDRTANRFKPILDKAWDTFSKWMDDFKKKIVEAFKPGDFDSSVDAINVGFLGALTLMFHRFLQGGLKFSFDDGIFKKIKDSFDQLTGTLKAMQTEVKAEAIEKIAISVGIMAASLLVLSLIDSKKLTQALLAITMVMSELVLVLKVLDDIGGGKTGTLKLASLSLTMNAMATSMLILSGAIAILAALDPLKLAGALAALTGAMAVLIGALNVIKEGGKDMISASIAMNLIAGSMVILSGAIAILAAIDPIKLAQALLAMGAGLASMVATLKSIAEGGPQVIAASFALNLIATSIAILGGALAILAAIDPQRLATALLAVGSGLAMFVATLETIKAGGPQIIAAAFALNLIATAMVILSKALELIGNMDWKTLDQGLLGMAAALAIIAAASLVMPDLLLVGAGLILVAIAINGLAIALKTLGEMKGKDLAQGLEGMGLALLILAAGAAAMAEGLPGAIALGVMAASMLLLTVVLEKLAAIKPMDLVKAILAMAAVIGTLAGLSLLLSSALVPMIAMAAGLALLGAAFVLLGGGIFLLGKGLQALAEFGKTGTEALMNSIHVLLRSVIAEFKNEIEDLLNAVPLLVRLIEAVLSQLLETITKLAPQIAKALIAIFKNGLKALREIYPDLIETGLFLLLKLLEGIAKNIDPIVTAVLQIIANFLQAIADNIGQVMDAGVNVITNFLLGLANAQDQIVTAVIQILAQFVQTVVDNVQMLIDAGTNMLIQLMLGITKDITKIVDAVTFIIETLILELGLRAIDIANTGTSMLIAFLSALTGDVIKVTNAIKDMIILMVTAFGQDAGDMARAGADALSRFLRGLGGDAIIIGNAMSALIHDIVTALVGVLDKAPDELNRLADGFIRFLNGLADVIRSKSGPLGDALGNIAEALVGGFADVLKHAILKFAEDAISGLPGFVKDGIIGTIKDVLGIKSPSKVMMEIGDLTAQGLIIGLSRGLATASTVAGDGATSITDSMSEALAKTSDILSNTAEFNPTITPVLDLTRVQTEAGKINDMMLAKISPDTSLVQANDISAQQAAINAAKAAGTDQPTPQTLEFNQTINAPQPLSANEVYRNTKSQIVLAKEELGISS